MTNEQFVKFCEEIKKEIVALAPKDTGNLAYNAIKMKMNSSNECEIYISGNSIKTNNGYLKYGVAPYVPFTIEPWVSPKWNGRKNPNEGWFEKAIESAVNTVSKKYDGESEEK